MTSRNSFFKWMIQDLKQRLWSIALSCVFFFFFFPVNAGFTYSLLLSGNDTMYEKIQKITDHFYNLMGPEDVGFTFLGICLAVLIALNGFGYLHKKTQVDFFHSLPIGRKKLFAVKFINGILIFAIPYFIFSNIATFIALATPATLPSAFLFTNASFLYHLLMIVLCYSAAVLAITLTGTTIMSIFGTIFFYIYIPCVYMLTQGYKSTYLDTFAGSDEKFEQVIRFTSPFSVALFFDKTDVDELLIAIITAAVMAICFTILALYVFRLRKSESAGQAISVSFLKTPLKILVVIPSGLFMAILISLTSSHIGWTIFAMLCGILLSHCVIEIIYHADFKKLFAHPLHLLFCSVVSLMIVLLYNYDLIGYDTYRPAASDIKSIGFYIYDQDPETFIYHEKMFHSDEYHYRSGLYGTNVETVIARNMQVSDETIINAILDEAISNEEQRGNFVQRKYSPLNPNSYANYNDAYDFDQTRIYLEYHLKNGKNVTRIYQLRTSTLKDKKRMLFANADYKKGAFPILRASIHDFGMFHFRSADLKHNKVYRISTPFIFENLDNSEQILQAYQQDLMNVDYETMHKDEPIGYVRFVRFEDAYGVLDYYAKQNGNKEQYYNNSNREDPQSLVIDEANAKKNSENKELVENLVDNSYDTQYYPVYESFTNVKPLLEQKGMNLNTTAPADSYR